MGKEVMISTKDFVVVAIAVHYILLRGKVTTKEKIINAPYTNFGPEGKQCESSGDAVASRVKWGRGI